MSRAAAPNKNQKHGRAAEALDFRVADAWTEIMRKRVGEYLNEDEARRERGADEMKRNENGKHGAAG